MVYVLILVIFVLLILVHEYGHFIAAKRNGVDVEEFGVGFPPRIAGKEMGRGIFRAYYSINALPLGGFVRMKGENEADKSKGSFGSAPYWAKVKIIAAGVFMNLVAAAVILTFLAWQGMPQVIDNQFKIDSDSEVVSSQVLAGYVDEDSPAEAAGIEFGDELISIGSKSIVSSDELFDLTEEFAGQEVDVVFIDDEGNEQVATAQLREAGSEDG
jgi:regulator of sigma E protease